MSSTRNFTSHFFQQISPFHGELATETVDHAESPTTFEDLFKLVQLFEEHLLKIGLEAGQHVVISGPNSTAFLCVSLAVWRLNAVLVPLNPLYKPAEFLSYLEQTDCKFLLIDAGLADRLDLKSINCNVEIYDENGLRQCKCKDCQAVEEPVKLSNPRTIENETAVLFFSSGSTGLPKLVKISHEALCAHLDIVDAARISQVFPKLSIGDVCLSILPYFHAGGLLTAFVMLAQGVRLIVWSRFDSNKFFDIIAKYSVTVLSIVPAVIDGIVKMDKLPESITKCLRYIFVGGDRLEMEKIEKMQQLLTPQQHLVQLYGTTEAGVLVFMQPILPDFPINSCGVPLPGVNVKCSENGELLLKTSTMMQGYCNHENAFDENGWLKTGDLVDLLSNGAIRITGRLKDIIKIKGWQISPYELENAVQRHFSEVDQIVVLEHESKLNAMVQLNSKLDEQQILDFVKDNFISYKNLHKVWIVSELPKTASGKVNRWQSHAWFVNNLITKST